ncbi:MAG TPA: mechanosensitive ion channel family protein [Rhizomicrobium sp.]|jgi:small-conductance mechanosensitive channel/CRP-like cAMP-binding protein|nr:mechanosensitive ion channel family protein [Rhizomicrobium sp.]
MMVWSILAMIVLVALRLWGVEPMHDHFSSATVDEISHGLMVAIFVCAALIIDGLVRHFYWIRYLRRRLNRETPALIQDLLTIALFLLGLSIGLSWEEGFSFTSFITASGATAIVLGIALQTAIQDLFAGLAINLDGSYSLGDWITVYTDQIPEPIYGRVTHMTWRSTFLALDDGRRVMLPNHIATANPVMNHSRPADAKRLSVEVSIDNRMPTDRVIDMLLGEAFKSVRRPGLARTPEPSVIMTKLTSDAMFYEVRFYFLPDQIEPSVAKSIVLAGLQDVVLQNNMPMPVTQIELVQPPVIDLVIDENEIRSALHHASLFSNVLNDEQSRDLAQQCRPVEFARGSSLMTQGEPASSMFIILEGAARVSVLGADNQPREVAVLATGDVVGEMSLMTGTARNATVAALTRLRALEVTKDPVESLLKKSPELLQRFGHVLAKREQERAAIANRAIQVAAVESDLITRMKTFFSRVLWSEDEG